MIHLCPKPPAVWSVFANLNETNVRTFFHVMGFLSQSFELTQRPFLKRQKWEYYMDSQSLKLPSMHQRSETVNHGHIEIVSDDKFSRTEPI